jgi:hypothetical protein
MSLDGLRAWIGEVERKLGARTRVFLALTVVSIGIAGAAVYLAIDARESSVSESDVQALQQELEAQIAESGAATASPPIGSTPELQPETAQGEPESQPEAAPNTGKKDAPDTPNGAANGGESSAKLQELVEKAKEGADPNE